MRFDLRLAVPFLAFVLHGTACRLTSCDEYATAGGPTRDPNSAGRAIAEADIVQHDVEQRRIYAISRGGSLAIVDIATPTQLRLLGKSSLSGVPFEMYRHGNVLLTMSNHAVTSDGKVVAPLVEGAPVPAPDPRESSIIAAVDVADPANTKTLATFKVPGEIADSRLVGHVLYLATYDNGSCYGCSGVSRTFVTSFDVSVPSAPKQVDQIAFAPISDGSYGAWTPWKRSILATDRRLYVGGLSKPGAAKEGIIEVLDISDPTGHMTRGATLTTAGPITSRWQMDEHDGVLRVVSQLGVGRTMRGENVPELDTFRVESAASVTPLGHLYMKLPRLESLKSVRFDGARAYAITFQQTDPLFTFDLSDPANPLQKGELEIPGWIFHLEPRGDRLIGLGLDSRDTSGNLNVSLFDVSDLAKPTLISRVSFGPNNAWGDGMITDAVLAEDQDRIQKAFRVFDDLIVVPFSAADWNDSCTTKGAGIQLIDWTSTTLTKRALLPMTGNARRALRRDSETKKEVIGISDTSVVSFSVDDRDRAVKTADVTIGTCVPRQQNAWMGEGDWGGGTCE
jgi:hypothetical protein